MKIFNRIQSRVYGITLFLLILSGFAQMPIFKRYYIADIPGFAWLAKYYVTHLIHYISATALIFFAFYGLTRLISDRTKAKKGVDIAGFHALIICGLIISGALLVIKNLSGVYFGHTLIITLDIIHVIFCMLLLIAGLYSVVRKRKQTWL